MSFIPSSDQSYAWNLFDIFRDRSFLISFTLYSLCAMVLLVGGIIYSTYFSYPSIQRDCSGLISGKPIGASHKRRRAHYRRMSSRPKWRRSPLPFHSPKIKGSPIHPEKHLQQQRLEVKIHHERNPTRLNLISPDYLEEKSMV